MRKHSLVLAPLVAASLLVWASLAESRGAESTTQPTPATGSAGAGDWPRWRGPDQNGVASQKNWKPAWPSAGPKVLWEATAGRGQCSMVTAGGKLYTLGTTAADEETIYCFDSQKGVLLWKQAYKTSLLLPKRTDGVGPTPTVFEGRLYALGGAADLHCLDALNGKVIWSKNLAKDIETGTVAYGYNCSPAVAGGVIAVPTFPGSGQQPRFAGPYPTEKGALIGFSTANGKELWRVKEGASGWSSPIVARMEGRELFVHATGQKVYGVEPSSGKVAWMLDAAKEGLAGGGKAGSLCSTPVIVGDKVMFSTACMAKERVMVCLKVTGGKAAVIWKNADAWDWIQSGTVWNDRYYKLGKKGIVCVELETGKTLWTFEKEGLSGSLVSGDGGGTPDGCLIVADGKILVLSGKGTDKERTETLTLLDTNQNGCSVLGTAKVLKSSGVRWSYSTLPLVSNGLIFCRNAAGNMVCLDTRPKE